MGKKQNNGQTYDQASVVPYRYRDGALEFCLITSTGKRRWGFPKGIIDPGESAAETALKEAEEEAGLQGQVADRPLGDYVYQKWGRSLHVVVMLMEVRAASDCWQESQLRDRQWVDRDGAEWLLCRRRLRQFVRQAVKRLENGKQ